MIGVVVLCALSRAAAAQAVLLELPAGVTPLIGDPEASSTPLWVGSQLAIEEAERIPFFPGIQLRYRPEPRPQLAAPQVMPQLGVVMQAPTHGEDGSAAELSQSVGAGLGLEGALLAQFRPTALLRVSLRPLLRFEWQLGVIRAPGPDDRIAPLFALGGGQLGLTVGPSFNAVELTLAHRLSRGGASEDYLRVVQRRPRLALTTTLVVHRHVQVSLRAMLHGAFPSSRASLGVALAGNMPLEPGR